MTGELDYPLLTQHRDSLAWTLIGCKVQSARCIGLKTNSGRDDDKGSGMGSGFNEPPGH